MMTVESGAPCSRTPDRHLSSPPCVGSRPCLLPLKPAVHLCPPNPCSLPLTCINWVFTPAETPWHWSGCVDVSLSSFWTEFHIGIFHLPLFLTSYFSGTLFSLCYPHVFLSCANCIVLVTFMAIVLVPGKVRGFYKEASSSHFQTTDDIRKERPDWAPRSLIRWWIF